MVVATLVSTAQKLFLEVIAEAGRLPSSFANASDDRLSLSLLTMMSLPRLGDCRVVRATLSAPRNDEALGPKIFLP